MAGQHRRTSILVTNVTVFSKTRLCFTQDVVALDPCCQGRQAGVLVVCFFYFLLYFPYLPFARSSIIDRSRYTPSLEGFATGLCALHTMVSTGAWARATRVASATRDVRPRTTLCHRRRSSPFYHRFWSPDLETRVSIFLLFFSLEKVRNVATFPTVGCVLHVEPACSCAAAPTYATGHGRRKLVVVDGTGTAAIRFGCAT